MVRVVKVVPLNSNRLKLSFSDGRQGVCDISSLVRGPQFLPLSDDSYFRHVAIDEHGAIFWPHGLDICPDVLHQMTRFESSDDLNR
jgi:Protein of unknown function (DUF2442)